MNKIPLARPFIPENAMSRLEQVLKSGFLSDGPVTYEFENKVANYIGARYGVSFNSCTTGMETALRSIGLTKGDEVIIPGYTFPATANAVYATGAEPVLVDVDKNTGNIDYSKIEQAINSRTKAIFPVSLFGNPLDYAELNRIKNKFGLRLIEDAACSIGSSYDGVLTGNLADATIFSFHPRKIVTTGEGGVLTTDNPEIARFCRSYKYFGMRTEIREGEIEIVKNNFEMNGSNFKLSSLHAALGISQMEIIDDLLVERDRLAKRYSCLLETMEEVQVLKVTPKGKHSYQSYCILLPHRNKIIEEMRKRGIETQVGSISLHDQAAFQNTRISGELKNSSALGNVCMALPFYNGMTEEEQDFVVRELNSSLQEVRS
ncbi:MAG: DegT/DnrJ/EryC1/StrS family aminotransferase [Nanoarchaeota archaeon]